MRTLPLLLLLGLACLVLYAESKGEGGGVKGGGGKGGRRGSFKHVQRKARKHGKLNKDQVGKFRKEMAASEKRIPKLEAYKKRLAARREKKMKKGMSEDQKKWLKTAQAAAADLQMEAPNEEPVDMFEINDAAGVSEFLLDGDIAATSEQLDVLTSELDESGSDSEGGSKRVKRQATSVFPKWTNATVNYYIDASINARKKTVIAAALAYLQANTCINFVNNAKATNRIKVFSGSGCYSSIGMVGGEQTLSLADGCEVIGTVQHEFAHALGVFHYQSRYDRDSFVTVDFNVINPDNKHNFDKRTSSDSINYTPYEYGSFLHYTASAFVTTSGAMSIVPKDADYLFTMGNRRISFYDLTLLNKHYGCAAKGTTLPKCKNGGFPNPRTPTKCVCPDGYGGTLCDTRPAVACGDGTTGATLNATSTWQEKVITVGDMNDSSTMSDQFRLCNYWVQAPTGKKVQVQIKEIWNGQCSYGCPFNGIELKTKTDQLARNPLYCCKATSAITSAANPTPIIAYNRYYYSEFTIQYRYV